MKKEQVKNQAAYYVTFNYNVVPENPVDSVLVLGDFNEWSLENAYVLKRNKKGDFEGKFKIPAGRDYHFRYFVNGNRWANEKDADRFEVSPLHPHIDNSVLSLPPVEDVITMKVSDIKVSGSAPSPKKKSVAKAEVKVEKKSPAKKAPAKKTASEKTPAKKVATKKAADKKAGSTKK